MSPDPSGNPPRPGQRFRRLRDAGRPPTPPAAPDQAGPPLEGGERTPFVWRPRVARLLNVSLVTTFRAGLWARYLLSGAEKVAVSIVVSLFTFPLLTPASKVALSNFGHTTEFSIGAAGLIGTVLVLTFTLSMIPVQRAAEAMPVAVF